MARKNTSSRLGSFFITCVFSAGAAFLLRGALQDYVASEALAYWGVFLACFLLFSWLSHHLRIRFDLKAKDASEVVDGPSRVARILLFLSISLLPFSFVIQDGGLPAMIAGAKEAPTMQQLIGREPAAGDAAAQQGYSQKDRDKLEKIIHEGAKHD